MFKRLAIITMAATMLAATPAYAGQWMQDSTGWWWQNDDGSYPYLACAWIDGNHDGVAENYCFDERGYLNMNPVDQGLTVNEDGALIYNGAVCTAVLPDGRDYEMGMAVNGERINWRYDIPGINELERQESEEKSNLDVAPNNSSDVTNSHEEIDPYELACRIVDLVNEERENRGESTLSINDELMDNAMIRAEEASQNFSHTRPDGSPFGTVISVKKYSAGENLIRLGAKDNVEEAANSAIEGWLKSSSHRSNMLMGSWTDTGVGVCIENENIYICQLFIWNMNKN